MGTMITLDNFLYSSFLMCAWRVFFFVAILQTVPTFCSRPFPDKQQDILDIICDILPAMKKVNLNTDFAYS